MIRAFFFSLVLMGGLTMLNAQVSETEVVLNKINRPALLAEFNFSPDLIFEILFEDMKFKGFPKASDSKGYKFYSGIIFEQISSDRIDLYLKVDDVKKEKDKSLVYMIIAKGPEDFVSGSSDAETFGKASSYLTGLMPKFEARQLEINITEQEGVIKKAEKSYNSLVGTGESLQARKAALEEDIARNLKAQEEQKAALEKERDLLETLKNQRK